MIVDKEAQFVDMREAYRRTLLELAQHDSCIYCLDSDTGGLEDSFGVSLPNQYVQVGIAEANLMTMAAALAVAGKIPFVNTMAGFASARACEQVKIDIAYNRLPVKIIATHSGVSAGHLGPTHHALEDLAIMRAFPHMTVIVPADAIETIKAVEAAVHIPGPVYIRLGRGPTELVYDSDYTFEVDRAVQLRRGTDVTIVACGPYPILASLEAHDRLVTEGIYAQVLNAHTIKPLDAMTLVNSAAQTRGFVTVEEHNIIGGLGSALAEIVSEYNPCPVYRIGIPDVFCDRVGSQMDLLAAYGVTADHIVEAVQLLMTGGRRHVDRERSDEVRGVMTGMIGRITLNTVVRETQ
jgi:transketolase